MRGRYSAWEDAGMAHLAAFFGVAIVVIVTPGQVVFTAFGVATGQAVWTLCTSLGLAALLLASEPAFVARRSSTSSGSGCSSVRRRSSGSAATPPPSRDSATSCAGRAFGGHWTRSPGRCSSRSGSG
jgi:hypothetical protein